MDTYVTVQGDTFDWIAKKLYSDEKRIDLLMGANPQYCDTIIFSAGVLLSVPSQPAGTSALEGSPSWRSET